MDALSQEETPSKLPPFGIRELYGPHSKPAVLHISAPQYDSTIKSYPDAVLSYIDDDDGETITVGSGLELDQRLAEPIVRRNLRRRSSSTESARNSSFDDHKIHLFDINRTQDSLVVWKEHEAYSSKTLREHFSKDGTSSDIKCTATAAETALKGIARSETSSPQTSAPPKQTQPDSETGISSEQDPVGGSSVKKAAILNSAGEEKVKTDQSKTRDITCELDDLLRTTLQGLENHVGGSLTRQPRLSEEHHKRHASKMQLPSKAFSMA